MRVENRVKRVNAISQDRGREGIRRERESEIERKKERRKQR